MMEQDERASSTFNPKIHSDSGYGSNKSNSQSQRSSGSSKSQQSSVSSGSDGCYPPHPFAPVSNADCRPYPKTYLSAKRPNEKRQGKKKASSAEKDEMLYCQEGQMEITNEDKIRPCSTRDTSETLQVANVTHALSCMKAFQDTISESKRGEDGCQWNKDILWHEYIPEEFRGLSNEDAFATIVSLDDNKVVYMTPTITNILGFPQELILGKTFIDFVHPNDRTAFSSHITCGINFSDLGHQNPTEWSYHDSSIKSEPFYCRLRKYNSKQTVRFGVTDKTILYHPFMLAMQLKKMRTRATIHSQMTIECREGTAYSEMDLKRFDVDPSFGHINTNSGTLSSMQIGMMGDSSKCNMANVSVPLQDTTNTTYLVVGAAKIKSAYQYPEEILKHPGKFVTRHSANCNIGHMDAEAIGYLGYLPQDLIGKSVLDYCHPEDMHLLRDIYEAVIQEQGKPFRSKPYRFRVFNGTFAMMQTDWSCFINPWSWKLEFVIGQHRIVQGPMNPNVFMLPPKEDELHRLSDEVLFHGKEIQYEIRKMLADTLTRGISAPLRQQSSRRRRDLAALMETLLEQMANHSETSAASQCSALSVMERDSVMLGVISPHTIDNSGSSSTPPSYSQLNYKENLDRFFQSQPKTGRSYESGESSNKLDEQNQSSSGSDSKGSQNIDYSSAESSIRNYSNESSDNNEYRYSTHHDSGYLTQEILTRHNQNMEKSMIQFHKESRYKHCMTPCKHNKDNRGMHSKNYLPHTMIPTGDSSGIIACPQQQSKGLKRTHNVSSGEDCPSSSKHPLLNPPGSLNAYTTSGTAIVPSYRCCYPSYVFPNLSSLWGGAHHSNINIPHPFIDEPGRGLLITGGGNKGNNNRYPLTTLTYTNLNVKPHASPFVFVPGRQQHGPVPQQVPFMPAGLIYNIRLPVVGKIPRC